MLPQKICENATLQEMFWQQIVGMNQNEGTNEIKLGIHIHPQKFPATNVKEARNLMNSQKSTL